MGPDVVDLRPLAKTGIFTYDPGYFSTASCASGITFVDGEKGDLLYRGYPIEQLADRSDYLECCYLLMHGELPDAGQYQAFQHFIMQQAPVHERLAVFWKGFCCDSHPMAMMLGVVGALSAFDPPLQDLSDPEQRKQACHRLIARMPTIVAMCYRYSIRAPFVAPRDDLSYSANILHMMFSMPGEVYAPNPVLVRALDRILILHADLEQNASTSTVRQVGSSGANPVACVTAGIASLWGPAHGGANEAVLKMLDEIGTEENIEDFIQGVKDKRYRLIGFGHRVYKIRDPRANIMRQTCFEVLEALGLQDSPRFRLAMKLEKLALEDPYFIERKLHPNVDFYSGIVLAALNIPASMFTPVFVLARTAGWLSHWNEMRGDRQQKIGHPRQLYTGPLYRNYVQDGPR